MKLFVNAILIFFVLGSIRAQGENTLFEEGVKKYKTGAYQESIDLLEEYLYEVERRSRGLQVYWQVGNGIEEV